MPETEGGSSLSRTLLYWVELQRLQWLTREKLQRLQDAKIRKLISISKLSLNVVSDILLLKFLLV
ncbi:MAG: hypothetical protein RMI49_04020 [Candidatus Caldarchaeum sp.]|nr:hypothetical protein [Candidatus Caldarchaeum sp.]